MKKIALLLFLFLETISYSQDKNIGGTPVKGIIPIKRTESRNLSNSKIKNESSDLTPSFVSTPTGSSQEVGITGGQLGVSLTGGATYDIPIAVPPGINGVIPEVNLSYNSQSGNGLAGYGWNISGVSIITRIPSTKYHDGINDPVDFDNLDRFSFEGKRLVVKDGTSVYGADGTVYETEGFSNIKITSYGVSPFGANYGPAYFIVEYPDGSIAQYGNSADSCSKTNWAINYWQNPQGVRISYVYDLANNSLNINSIKYGSTGLNTPINEIKFIYKTRQRAEEAYIAGDVLITNNILSEIKVLGNGIGFRNYVLTHDTTIGYERLKSITEKSGDNTKSYNPTVFNYDTSSDGISDNYGATIGVGGINFLNTEYISGDYDGDGSMDFLLYPKNDKTKYWLFNNLQPNNNNPVDYQHNVGTFKKLFSVNWLGGSQSYGYKLMPNQGWCVVKTDTATNVTTFDSYSVGITNPILLQDTKQYTFPKFTYQPEFGSLIEKDIPKEFVEGDFNGDSLTDVLIIERNTQFIVPQGLIGGVNQHDSKIPIDGGGNTSVPYTGNTYFMNLDKRISTNYTNIAGQIQAVSSSKFITADVNGDGASDLLVFDSGKVSVYSLNSNNELVLLFAKTDGDLTLGKQILGGDFNGDGKYDFIISIVDGTQAIFKSTGTGFIKSNFNTSFFLDDYGTSTTTRHYMTNDFNKDGKTDIMSLATGYDTSGGYIDSFISASFMINSSTTTTSFDYFNHDEDGYISSPYITQYPLPIFLNFDKSNHNMELSVIADNGLYNFKFKKDFTSDVLLKKITTGNGVTESITYKPLVEQNQYSNDVIPFYRPANYIENYPSFDIKNAPSFRLVSKLEKQSQTTYKRQLYAYYGAVSNVDGLGFSGFRSICKTNWYNDNSQLISDVTNYDISLRGAVVNNYSFLNPSYGFEIMPSSFITKSVLSYNYSLAANKVFKIWNTNAIAYNGLNNTSKETTTTYDIYNNPKSNTVLIKSGSTLEQTESTSLDYFDQPIGSSYVIGRLIKKNTSVTHNSDTTTGEEVYSYTNHLLSQIKKKGHLTNYLYEDNGYDTFGNLIKKTITANGLNPRVTNYEYDISGRFLIKSLDVEGLATQFSYNVNNGSLDSQTNPYGLATLYSYDAWGKKITTTNYITVTDNIGKKKYTTYTKPESTTTLISVTGDDGSSSIIKYDDLGREIITGSKNIDNNWSYIKTTYDDYDRKISISEPVAGINDSPTKFATSAFDEYGRLSRTVELTGKTTNITYTGLTTIAVDDIKTVSTTKNAIGNIISMTDNGGTITYEYFANGNLKKSNYAGAIVNLEYDGWGRKTKMTDSSAGIYSYVYNEIGETIKQTTPKGETIYDLDLTTGKLLKKTVLAYSPGTTTVDANSTNTNITSIYTYDGTNKWLIKIDVTNPNDGNSTYTYSYDTATKQLNGTIESLPYATFTKVLSFDSFGRVNTETSTASAHNKTSSKTITYVYNNGVKSQILEGTAMKWKANTVNARGQLTSASLGNGIEITNTYDAYGYTSQNKHLLGTTNVMTLDNVFEPVLGNLTNRYNSMFDTRESFKYDTFDRLTTWDGNGQNVLTLPFNTTTEGFTFTGTSTQGSVTNVTGTMKVVLKNTFVAAKKAFTLNVATGNKLRIKADVTNKTGTTGVIVDAVMVETDPADANNYAEIYLGTVNNGTFDSTYEVSDFLPNPKLTLKFVIDESSPEGSNGGGTIPPNTTFYIDNLRIDNVTANTQTYDSRGRITANSLGNYQYTKTNASPSQPYLNTSVTTTADADIYYATRPLQTISYNVFKAPLQIEEQGVDKISFGYNVMQQRSIMYYGNTNTDKITRPYRKYYSADGTMEIKATFAAGNTTTPTAVEFITYIGGDAYSAPMVVKSDGTTPNYFYLHRDYQGSILAVTNASGAVVEKRLFDPWGAIVKVQDGTGNNLTKLTFFDRGYTGHQHLESVGLIHMNGRLYDPKLHRFLQPDNFVQDPYNTQNYNRYGYVMNNPFKFTDPSGEFWHIIIGAVIGGLVNWGVHGFQFNMQGLKAFGIGAGAGALGALTGGAAFAAAGGAAGGIGGFVAGAAGGMAGAAFSSVFLTMGNFVAFGDPLMSGQQFITGVAIGGITGGLINGGSALYNGRGFLTGLPPRVAVQPITIQSAGLAEVEQGLQPEGKSIGNMPKVASPQEIKEAAKPLYLERIAGPDGKFTIRTNAFMAEVDTSFKTLTELGLEDGMEVTSSKALELGQQFLGEGYKEVVPGSGRYVSADGTRVFRMGVNDILGNHGGGPHVNFETLVPNPDKVGKMMVDLNYHIYIKN